MTNSQQPARHKSRPSGHGEDIAAAPVFGPRDWLLAAILVVAVFLAYQPAWQGGFVWDDDAYVLRHDLHSFQGLARIWSDFRATQQYFPLLHTAFWLEYRLWGQWTTGYHLVAIALHCLAAILFWQVLRRLAIPGSYLAAALFALHPVHVESVAWIAELKNTLSGVLYLGAALAYLAFDRARTVRSYALAAALFVLALLSKTTTATLPAALLLIFWWKRGRITWKRDVLPLLPLFLVGAGQGLFTAWIELQVAGAEGADFGFPWLERCLLAGRTAWFYLGKLFWPTDLIFMYPRWQVSRAVAWQYLPLLAVLAALVVLWRLRPRTRAPLAAALFFLGTLFPVAGFLNLYVFRYSLVADHFQYLPSLGIIALFAAGVALLLKPAQGWRRVSGQMGCLALVALLAILTWRQSRMYADIETLYRTTIDRNPACWMVHCNLGNLLGDRGHADEAIVHYRKALEIKPDHVEAQYNLGNALANRGQVDEAIAHFQKALEIKPDHVRAHANLGSMLARRGRLDEAIAQYLKALEIQPDYVKARCNLGDALARSGQIDEAIAQYHKALEIEPNNVWALNNIAWHRATHPDPKFRDGGEAVVLARRAAELSPDDPNTLGTLAAAYAEAGRFAEAAQTARRAVNLATQQNNPTLALSIRAKLRLYESGAPFRDLQPAVPARPRISQPR